MSLIQLEVSRSYLCNIFRSPPLHLSLYLVLNDWLFLDSRSQGTLNFHLQDTLQQYNVAIIDI